MRSWRTPVQYVVFDKDRLCEILSQHNGYSTIDKIKLAILHELIDDGCTMNDAMLVFNKYAIDYHARWAIIEMKRSVSMSKELPDEVWFVTQRVGEESNVWGWY